jgi:hypothetical protein
VKWNLDFMRSDYACACWVGSDGRVRIYHQPNAPGPHWSASVDEEWLPELFDSFTEAMWAAEREKIDRGKDG